jgi:pimeloyl-ACP methyl ester carboxylesterase
MDGGADSFDLIGHSMGGFIGISLAAHHRRSCTRLVLIDALGVPESSALVPIGKSVSRLGRTYPSTADALSYVRSSGTVAVVDLDSDHYTVLTDPVAIETIERFLRGKVLGAR